MPPGAGLSAADLAQLPPSIASIISQQQLGAGSPDPNLQQIGDQTASDLNGALQRRFGQGANFDPTYDAGVRGLMSEIPRLQNQYELGTQRANEDFMTASQKLAEQNQLAQTRQQNAMANQGLGYSGANLLGQQRLGQAFEQSVFGENQTRNRQIGDLTNNNETALQNIMNRERSLEADATQRASVADQTRAWEQAQQQAQQAQLQQQQQLAQQQMQQQQQALAAQQAAMQALEQQAIAAVQPVPTSTGAVAPAPEGGVTNNTVQLPWDPNTNYDITNSDNVRAIQQGLVNAGYNIPVDGVWGPQTQQTLQQAQQQFNSTGPTIRVGRAS